MRVMDIAVFAIRDLAGRKANRKVGPEVMAGAITLALATAISALSAAFSGSATHVIEAVLEPVRAASSTVWIEHMTPGQKFSTQEYGALRTRIDALKKARVISVDSPIVRGIINGDRHTIRLLNSGRTRQDVTRFVVWSAPPDAPFLTKENGMQYASGDAFGEPGRRPKCAADALLTEAQPPREPPKGWNDGYRPKIGVIVNTKYLPKFDRTGQGKHQAGGAIDPSPAYIWVRLHLDAEGVEAVGGDRNLDLAVCVSGVVEAKGLYPFDVIFTEDVARAYFEARERFPWEYAKYFDQWENARPLAWVAQEEDQTAFKPRDKGEFDYATLRRGGAEPYSLVVAGVRDWRTVGKRGEVKKELEAPTDGGRIDGEAAKNVMYWAMIAAKQTSDESTLSRAKDELEEMLEQALVGIPGVDLSHEYNVQRADLTLAPRAKAAQAEPEVPWFVSVLRMFIRTPRLELAQVPHDVRWVVSDHNTEIELRGRTELGEVHLWVKPPWRVTVPKKNLVRALLRLKSVVDAYDAVMGTVVGVLAFSAALLLTFGHILRKSRDIGILTTNGAGRSDIIAIYTGQITILAITGWVAGIGLAYVGGFYLEAFAADTLQRFIETEEAQKVLKLLAIERTRLLALQFEICVEAFKTVVPAAIVGAVIPVAWATWIDPLDNVEQGS